MSQNDRHPRGSPRENPGIHLRFLQIRMEAFDPIAADFSNLADLKKLSKLMKGPSNLYISDVLHRGFVEVNEEGSEAATVTAVVISVFTTSVHYVPPPKTFTADHPFLFMIRDTKSSAILFMGRLSEPK